MQVDVIMIEYTNHLRAQGYSIEDSAVEGAILRLRPIMMTMLLAMLGLLPAALSRDWLGLAEAVCDCDRGRIDCRIIHQHLFVVDDARLGGTRH